MSTRVFSFGSRPPATQAETVGEHYFRANRYRNDLCALERRRRQRVADAQRRHFPAIVALETQIDDIDSRITAIQDAIRKANAAARTKRVPKQQREQIDALKLERKPLYEALKAAKSDAFGPEELKTLRSAFGKLRERVKSETRKRDVSADPEVARAARQVADAEAAWFKRVPHARQFRAELDTIEADHHAEYKRLRSLCGVHFGTYLAIEKAAESFRAGAPPQFKRFRGDGKIGVQIQGGKPFSDFLLASHADARQGQFAVIGYDPHGRFPQRVTAKLRIGSSGPGNRVPTWADFPAVMHRPVPADARVMWVYVVRNRVGTQDQHHLQLTLDRASDDLWWAGKPKRADRGIVAVDVGWRSVPDGLRVAYWVGNDGREGEIVLPKDLLKRLDRPAKIQSLRDIEFASARLTFCRFVRSLRSAGALPDWLRNRTHVVTHDDKGNPVASPAASRPLPADDQKKPAPLDAAQKSFDADASTVSPDGMTRRMTCHTWRAPAKLASIVLYWRDHRFKGDEDAFDQLERWRAADKLKYNQQEHGRQSAIAARDEIYKRFAARLRTEYRTLIVEKINWREAQQTQPAERDTDQGMVGRFREASVGKLVELLSQSMTETVRLDPRNTSSMCHACGKPSGEPNPAALMHTCSHCDATYDQDRNAALNLLGKYRT